MPGKTTVVLGGGIGGVVAANRLRGRLGKEHRVVLVDRQDKHYFAPSFPWVMDGWRKAGTSVRPLSSLEKKGIEFVQGSVTGIDLDTHKVHTDTAVLDWDYLVIALGTEMEPDAVPGMAETAHGYYTLEGAAKLHEALQTFDGGKNRSGHSRNPLSMPGSPLRGCFTHRPPHPQERAEGPRGDKLLYAGAGAPARGWAGDGRGRQGRVAETRDRRRLRDKPRKRRCGAQGAAIRGWYPTIPRHRVSAVVSESGLTGETGWIEADRSTLATEAPGVYALGDAVFIKLASGLPLPKAGVFASGQAEVIVRNIASRIQGGNANARFEGHGSCFLEIGGRKAGMAVGDFYAEPAPR